MSAWPLPAKLIVTASCAAPSRCFSYASHEAVRLLSRVGIAAERREKTAANSFELCLGEPAPAGDACKSITHDGYLLQVTSAGARIAAPTAKGVLNGVYDLAERLGFLFLTPGEEGEWAPQLNGKMPALPLGEWCRQPRFPHRGVFGGLRTPPFTAEQWLRFFAKLRFNAQSHQPENAELADELGIRLEIGGHGMSSLLPRELFATQPDLFRMFQPEDFDGKRLADSNMCPTNPETATIVRDNFRQQIRKLRDVYAVHAWADDLPGGGWCMCSRCRAFSASDQSLLAMNMQAEAVREEGATMRIPAIAYHDTLYPGSQIKPAPECFLLYAPRERCYAHALDDPSCAKNRWHLAALEEWMKVFAESSDAHTFEYYFDQILFRGLYPFLPDIIIGDMTVYERAGIESHMSLQVGGVVAAPDYNLLAFAHAHWDATLAADTMIVDLARRIAPEEPEPWVQFLELRRQAYKNALTICDVPNDIYFDYRFMPETYGDAGARMVLNQKRGAQQLRHAAEALEKERPRMSGRIAELADREIARAKFEAEDVDAMAMHQAGLNGIARYLNTRDTETIRGALADLESALAQLQRADGAADAAGIPEQGAYYHSFNRDWSRQEISKKIEIYRKALP